MNKIKRKKDELYDDSWMYILLLVTTVILAESLKSYSFVIFNTPITYSVFLIPLIFLITNYITKKYDYNRSIVSIAISGLALVLYVTIMGFALRKQIIMKSIGGEFCAYVVSQLVNLTIYSFLLNNTKANYFVIVANYLFSLIIFYMFYVLINLNIIVLSTFWKGYLITITIQLFICIVVAYIDHYIQRGR